MLEMPSMVKELAYAAAQQHSSTAAAGPSCLQAVLEGGPLALRRF